MRVSITTDNGRMEVDLEQFFPAQRAKVRKLFRLMCKGMDRDSLREVKGYLYGKKARAEQRKADMERELSETNERISRLDQQIAELNAARDNSRIAKSLLQQGIREEERMLGGLPVYIQDFADICIEKIR